MGVTPWRPLPDHTTSAQSVRDYLEGWLRFKGALRPSTRLAYQNHIDRFLSPSLGHRSLTELTVRDVEEAFAAIQAGAYGTVSITTVHRILATLMSALNSAVRRGLLPANPAGPVELPRIPHTEMTTWTLIEASTFLQKARDHRWYLLYRLLLICGLRRGEALGLQWKDLTPDGKALLIRRQLTLVAGRPLLGEPKSSRGRRTVHLDEDTGLLLQAHRPGTTIPPGFLFCDDHGQPLDAAAVSREFTRLTATLGLPRIRLHDLRHTSASLGLEAGEPIAQVSRRLGHATIAITGDIYTHVSSDAAQRAVDTLLSHLNQPVTDA